MAITRIVQSGPGAGVLLTNTNRFDDLVNLARKNASLPYSGPARARRI